MRVARTTVFALVFASGLGLGACTSDEEKARARELAMIEQAKADSVDEAQFVADSLALAASITLDTVQLVRIVNQTSPDDSDVIESVYQAVSRKGQVCLLEFTRYKLLAVGDTLSCQWAPQ
jgi:hypothetical protein